ncbi:MAG: cupin domain-containing protein [Rubrivivax sp.]|nr:cupin domain-containing protein [Rubrivivax sp.]
MSDSSEKARELRAQLIRNWDEVPRETLERAPRFASCFASLAAGTAARKLGASVDTVPPGSTSCPYHYHLAQEEMFVLLQGEGTLRVAGERLAVRAGDVIFIPSGPVYPHHLINTSQAPLTYLSIGTQERPEICGYPDSGKLYASHPGARLLQKPENNLDYWEGEG